MFDDKGKAKDKVNYQLNISSILKAVYDIASAVTNTKKKTLTNSTTTVS